MLIQIPNEWDTTPACETPFWKWLVEQDLGGDERIHYRNKMIVGYLEENYAFVVGTDKLTGDGFRILRGIYSIWWYNVKSPNKKRFT